MEYWYYEEDELDKMLEKFWFGAHKDTDSDNDTDDGDQKNDHSLYSASTMKNFRYALNRILRNKGHLYEIINPKHMSFQHSQKAYFASQKELKAKGKGTINSAPEIPETGTIAFT